MLFFGALEQKEKPPTCSKIFPNKLDRHVTHPHVGGLMSSTRMRNIYVYLYWGRQR